MAIKKTKTEKMIYDIFRLCDKTVWLEDFLDFQKGFEKILKKRGYNLWKIYFGVPSEEVWRQKCKKSWEKYQKADHTKTERRKRKNPNVYYIKNRAYKLKKG